MGTQNSQLRRRGQRGATIVEFGLALLPTFGFLFLFLNLAWLLFEWVCVQEAVREGVRAAVTCYVPPQSVCPTTPFSTLNGYTDCVIEQYSMGFITSGNVSQVVSIQYLDPSNLTPLGATAKVATGDVVKVTISGLKVKIFAPILYTPSPLYVGAVSADVMACLNPITPGS